MKKKKKEEIADAEACVKKRLSKKILLWQHGIAGEILAEYKSK